MSKMDGLRAMREARYAEAQARAGQAKPAVAKAAPVAPPAPKTSAPKKASAPQEPSEPEDGLCGHRSMNGRTCTREHGHAAKSHRYG
jgi:hypothetical protein